MARMLAMTEPNTTSHRIGWTARVTISTGSRVTLCSSERATERVSRAKRSGAGGSAQAAGRATGASRVTEGSSCVDRRAGGGPEDVIERGARPHGRLEFRGRADGGDP